MQRESSSFRQQRVADLLLSFIAGEMRTLTDPRLQFVTFTEVEVTPDLRVAHIYWTALGVGQNVDSPEILDASRAATFLSQTDIDDIGEALAGTESLLKRRIGDELELRYTPRLIFKYDHSQLRGARIDELLKRVEEK